MKFRYLILFAVLIGCMCGGCVSLKPQKLSLQIQKWVPIGTPVAKAEHIMAHHGFDCQILTKDHPFNQYGVDILDCDMEQIRLHDWNVKFFLKDGKVSGYGRISVDDESFEIIPPG